MEIYGEWIVAQTVAHDTLKEHVVSGIRGALVLSSQGSFQVAAPSADPEPNRTIANVTTAKSNAGRFMIHSLLLLAWRSTFHPLWVLQAPKTL